MSLKVARAILFRTILEVASWYLRGENASQKKFHLLELFLNSLSEIVLFLTKIGWNLRGAVLLPRFIINEVISQIL